MNELRSKSKHLSFEWDENGERLEIHGDREGLEVLVADLQLLLAKDENDHIHLMTPEWGGEELSSEQQNPGAKLINHVKILRWK